MSTNLSVWLVLAPKVCLFVRTLQPSFHLRWLQEKLRKYQSLRLNSPLVLWKQNYIFLEYRCWECDIHCCCKYVVPHINLRKIYRIPDFCHEQKSQCFHKYSHRLSLGFILTLYQHHKNVRQEQWLNLHTSSCLVSSESWTVILSSDFLLKESNNFELFF